MMHEFCDHLVRDSRLAQARRDLDEENAALPGKIRELRRQQQGSG
jgi:hypothetical protein